ncbi:MAG: lytic transglycosylase domain-containing protein [Rhodospirillales bacterium]|nr:lytic transglycosylase domain-containing protein [Rhodospirillales bacterium]
MAMTVFAVISVFPAQMAPAMDHTQDTVMSANDRAQTLQALKSIKRGQWTQAEKQIAATRDPLAMKIYYWLAYTKDHGDISFARITRFMDQVPDWPGQKNMRLAAEKALAKGAVNRDVVDWFGKYEPLTTDGVETYLDALQAEGLDTKAQAVARLWWQDALTSPGQQDRFLRKYGKYLNEDAHRRRLDKLLFREHFTNARAVAQILGRGYPALTEARIALAADHNGVDGRIASVPAHLARDPGLLYERLRWRRRHDMNFQAMEMLHNPPPAGKITNLPDWWKERHIIARRLMEEKKYESAYLLVSAHQQEEGLGFAQAEFLAGFLALRFLDKPWRAFEHFEALYHRTETPVSRSRGAYWAGRASEALGHHGIAQQWYHVAARYQTAYYGQLALYELDEDYKPPQQLPPKRELAAQNAFNRSEMVQVTRLLHKAGFRTETSQFLNALADKTIVPEDYVLVADLAVELDHYHNAVRIAKKGLQKNIMMMDFAYPSMLARMKGIPVEWAMVHAVIRQESSFDYDAQSPAGARGLMQLMPATAAEVARKNGWSHRTEWLTSRPDHNIRLGSTYLKQMVERYDGSYALALAAYNGGPGRVDRWLREIGDPRKGEIDMLDWVELIPVYETRNYVQRVMEGAYVYRIKMKDVQQSVQGAIHVAYREAK